MVTTRKNKSKGQIKSKHAARGSTTQTHDGSIKVLNPDHPREVLVLGAPPLQSSPTSTAPIHSVSGHHRSFTSPLQSEPSSNRPEQTQKTGEITYLPQAEYTLGFKPATSTESHHMLHEDLAEGSEARTKIQRQPHFSETPITGVFLSRPKEKDGKAHLSYSPQSTCIAESRVVPKEIEGRGTAHDPIILGNSPISRPIQLKKRKKASVVEQPHKFMDRGYRKLYNYRSSRPPLTLRPVSETTFTGHQSHDIYRVMSAKLEGESHRSKDPVKHPSNSLSFQAQHHPSIPGPTHQPYGTSAMLFPHMKCHGHPCSFEAHHAPSAPSEEALRKKALQYVREYSLPTLRNKDLSQIDPDETSTSESEPIHHHPPLHSLPSQHQPMHYSHLTQLSSILSSLLHCYPTSPDKLHLRQDIQMILIAQHQIFQKWSDSEPKPDKTTSQVVRAVQQAATDEKMRRVLSSSAEIWSGGAGGVADVYRMDEEGKSGEGKGKGRKEREKNA